MTISTSRTAYSDCFDLFDRALDSPRGIRNRCRDAGAANHLKVRLHYARTLSRREAREVYAEDDPAFGVSPYDPFVVRVRAIEGVWWVYIEPRAVQGEVEELGAAE
jgi:hypothetical protein